MNHSQGLDTHEPTLRTFLKSHKRYPIISVTGPAGAGKSTISKIIADLYDALLLSETPEDNEYLKIIKSTNNKISRGLWYQNQMTFLSQDSGIIAKGFQQSENVPIVFDFDILQTQVYAYLQLKNNELKSFRDSYHLTSSELPNPDICIQVTAPEGVLIERYAGRNTYIDDQLCEYVGQILRMWEEKELIHTNLGTEHILFENGGSNISELPGKILDILSKKI